MRLHSLFSQAQAHLRHYFTFNRQDKRVLLLLLLSAVLLKITAEWYFYRRAAETTTLPSQTLQAAATWLEQQQTAAASEQAAVVFDAAGKPIVNAAYFPFDPNQITLEECLQLGIKQYVCNNLIKYRQKGGAFKKKEDFGKLYGLSAAEYQRLEPFLQLPASVGAEPETSFSTASPPPTSSSAPDFVLQLQPFNPNEWSEQECKQMGLPAAVCKTIQNFLAKGGTFRIKSDVAKIYNLPPDLYRQLEPYIQLPAERTSAAANNALATNTNTPTVASVLAPFDPNLLNAQQAEALGLSAAQFKSIRKYVEKGGVFRKKEDFKKMYVISEEEYRRLEPYIEIAATLPTALQLLNINTATIAEWLQLPDMNENIAQDIINYRSKLGGFVEVAQLKEVKSVKSAWLSKIKNRLQVDPAQVQRLNINRLSEAELARHEYIAYSVAVAIVQMRQKAGAFTSVAQLAENPAISAEQYKKIAPYLRID